LDRVCNSSNPSDTHGGRFDERDGAEVVSSDGSGIGGAQAVATEPDHEQLPDSLRFGETGEDCLGTRSRFRRARARARSLTRSHGRDRRPGGGTASGADQEKSKPTNDEPGYAHA
jgi:hypothetical protein